MSFNTLLPAYQVSTPDVNNLLQPLAQGFQGYVDRTRKAAIGDRLAAGDYTGASAEAGRQGDIDTALGIARFKTQQTQADTAQKLANVQLEQHMAGLYGGVAQMVAAEQDPAKAAAMWQRVVGAHPEMGSKLTTYGIDPTDHKAGAAFLAAQARGYRDETKDAIGKTQLEANQIAVLKARRELEQPKHDLKMFKEGEQGYDTRTGTWVTPPQGDTAPKEFRQAAAKQVAEIYGDYIKDGQKAAQSAMDLTQLSQLSDVLGSGKFSSWLPVVGPWAQSLGVTIDGLNEAQAFQAIVSRVAPSMRPTGSGSTSDKDMAIFMNSLPQLSQTAEGRRMVIQHLQDMTQFSQQRAAIASAVMTGKMTTQDGEAAISRLTAPAFQSKVATPGQAKQSVQEGTVIANAKGEKLVMRGGKWVPMTAIDPHDTRSGVE